MLLKKPEEANQTRGLINRLCGTVAARRNPTEFSNALVRVAALKNPVLQKLCLDGFRAPIKSAITVALTQPASASLKQLAATGNAEVRAAALALVRVLKLETAAERTARMNGALREMTDVKLPVARRLAAVRGQNITLAIFDMKKL